MTHTEWMAEVKKLRDTMVRMRDSAQNQWNECRQCFDVDNTMYYKGERNAYMIAISFIADVLMKGKLSEYKDEDDE